MHISVTGFLLESVPRNTFEKLTQCDTPVGMNRDVNVCILSLTPRPGTFSRFLE
jgi:hypothetical protein